MNKKLLFVSVLSVVLALVIATSLTTPAKAEGTDQFLIETAGRLTTIRGENNLLQIKATATRDNPNGIIVNVAPGQVLFRTIIATVELNRRLVCTFDYNTVGNNCNLGAVMSGDVIEVKILYKGIIPGVDHLWVFFWHEGYTEMGQVFEEDLTVLPRK